MHVVLVFALVLLLLWFLTLFVVFACFGCFVSSIRVLGVGVTVFGSILWYCFGRGCFVGGRC